MRLRHPAEVQGKRGHRKGAGLSDEGTFRKQQIVWGRIEKHDLYNKDPLDSSGNCRRSDIAGLTGVCIGVICRVPVGLTAL